jgi:hypothetical protein
MTEKEFKEQKDKESLRNSENKSPYKNISEAQMAVVNSAINPRRDRLMEFSNVKESMVFAMAMSIMREAAADPMRDRIKEPLSEVWRTAYFQLQRGVGFKMAMLAGNVALGLRSGEESDFPAARNTSRM